MAVSELCLIIIKSDMSLAVSIVRNDTISSESLTKSTLLQYIIIPLDTKKSFRVFVSNILMHNEPLCKAFGFLL